MHLLEGEPMKACAYVVGPPDGPGAALRDMAKGLGFPCIYVAGLQALPMHHEPLDEAARLIYVAMTRATRELVLSTHGPSPIVERVRASLTAVAREFAEA